jgi:hypothetical protein
MRRTRKLFYAPGLISLIGLLLSLPSFYKNNSPVKQCYLTSYVVPDCNGDPEMFYQFSKCNLESEMGKRRQIKFTLDNNKEENKSKMEMIQYEALKLKYTEDTSNVILINLTDSIIYGDFVSIVDMCEADGHKLYASWDNKFVIFEEWPKKETKNTDTIALFSCGYIPLKKIVKTPGLFDVVIKKIKDRYTSQGLYLLIGFLVLLFSYLLSIKLRTARHINIAETPS